MRDAPNSSLSRKVHELSREITEIYRMLKNTLSYGWVVTGGGLSPDNKDDKQVVADSPPGMVGKETVETWNEASN